MTTTFETVSPQSLDLIPSASESFHPDSTVAVPVALIVPPPEEVFRRESVSLRTPFRWTRLAVVVTVARMWQVACLMVLLAIAATIPILQWASLGYLIDSAARIGRGNRWREVLPGLKIAGKIGVIAAGLFVTWLPFWLATNFAYQAELIEPGSQIAFRWRIAAGVFAVAWIVYGIWAVARGGRVRDFIWPAPIRFFREFFSITTVHRLEDMLWTSTVGLQLPRLIWLGLRATIGALIWLAIPASLVVIGMQAFEQPGRAAIGVVGFFLMWWVLLHLPFLQIQMAIDNRFKSYFRLSTVRLGFKRAPWAFFIASLFTLGLALPLYLLRIEVIPKELLWLPCLIFVGLTLPAKLLVGIAMRRGLRERRIRWWPSRYLAWVLQVLIVPVYILFLYLGSIASWDGPLVVFLQHAFLTPAPFLGQ